MLSNDDDDDGIISGGESCF